MMEISTATLDRPAEVKKGHHKWTKKRHQNRNDAEINLDFFSSLFL